MPESLATREREEAETRRFMTLRVAGDLYAIPANSVREVVKPSQLAQVPLAPKALLGLANLRGSVLPVASLALLLGRRSEAADGRARVIVLDGKAPFGLMVDEVDALVRVETSRVKGAEAHIGAGEGEVLSGVFQAAVDGEPVKILDMAALLAKAFSAMERSDGAGTGGAARQQARSHTATDDREILIVFDVAGQEFSLPIANVVEVLPAPSSVTALPQSETAVLGMVALRGSVLPLLSLKVLLGLPGENHGAMVIVATIGEAVFGLAVDDVREIFRADRSALEPVPAVIANRTKGEAKVQSVIKADGGERLISVLTPDQLFREDIMSRIRREAVAAPSGQGASSNASERTFLIFRLGGQEYGLAISAVEEVARTPEQVTRLPRSPDFLRGVINLRGAVLPIIDQRKRFNLPDAGEQEAQRLVVMRIDSSIAGFIVDDVSEVLRTPENAIEPAPEVSGEAVVLEGVLNLESRGRMILLLDPKRLLSRTEQGLLDALGRVDEAQSAIDQDTRR